MKRFARLFLWFLLAALLLGSAAASQWYLRTHLVVTAEGHEHAHGMAEEEHHHGEGHGHEEEAESDVDEVLLGVNLVTNFGFEVGSLLEIYAWEPSGTDPGTSAWRELGTGTAGSACAALAADPSSSGAELVWKQPITSFPKGVDLEVGAMIRTAGLHGNAFVRLSGFRSAGEGQGTVLAHLFLNGLEGNSDWSELKGSVYVPPEVELLLMEVGFLGTGRAWFDSVRAVPREHTLPPPATGVNLLVNPDFREGLSGWCLMFNPSESPAGWSIEENGPTGFGAIRLQPPLTADRSGRIFLYQSVSGLEGGGKFATLSGMANTRELEGEAFLVLVFYTPEGMIGSDPVGLAGGRDLSELKVEMPVPEDARTAFAYLVAGGRGTALFSDIDLRIQPLP